MIYKEDKVREKMKNAGTYLLASKLKRTKEKPGNQS